MPRPIAPGKVLYIGVFRVEGVFRNARRAGPAPRYALFVDVLVYGLLK